MFKNSFTLTAVVPGNSQVNRLVSQSLRSDPAFIYLQRVPKEVKMVEIWPIGRLQALPALRQLQIDDIPIRLARGSTQRMHYEACRMDAVGGARSPDGSDDEVSLSGCFSGLSEGFASSLN